MAWHLGARRRGTYKTWSVWCTLYTNFNRRQSSALSRVVAPTQLRLCVDASSSRTTGVVVPPRISKMTTSTLHYYPRPSQRCGVHET